MDIISIVNHFWPNTIAKLAINASDFPNGETSIPFMGVFVQLFPDAKLPTEDDVRAYGSTYDAMIAQQKIDANAKSALPNDSTLIAHLIDFAVNGTPIPDAAIAAANAKLVEIGQPEIAIPVDMGAEQIK